MATRTDRRHAPAWVTERSRHAAAGYLGLAGLANLVAGAWLASNAGADWLVTWLVGVLIGRYGELGGLSRGGSIAAVATWGAWIGAALLVVLAALALYGCWLTIRGLRWRRALGTGVLAGLNPVALPLGAVAVALLVLGRRQFRDAPPLTPF